jgi:hypothetical protein
VFEKRRKFINAATLNRKSAGAKPRDLRFGRPLVEMFFGKARRRGENIGVHFAAPAGAVMIKSRMSHEVH